MTHRAEPSTARSPAIEGSAVAVVVASATVWWLSGAGPPAPAAARMLADGAAVCVLGFAVIPFLSRDPLRTVLRGRAQPLLRVATPLWLVAEIGRLLVMAGQAAGVPAHRLPSSVWWLYATATDTGRATLVAAAAAAGCLLLLAHRRTGAVIAGLAALGLAARAWAGHTAATPAGVATIAVHAVAAGLWCGGLLALAMTVRHRDEWARVLPGYARLALAAVLVLSVSAVIGATLVLPSWSALWDTGYGRVLSVKTALMVALVLIGWRQRTRWVPAAQVMAAASSHRRAVGEVAVLASALMAAAILAMTG